MLYMYFSYMSTQNFIASTQIKILQIKTFVCMINLITRVFIFIRLSPNEDRCEIETVAKISSITYQQSAH